MKKETEAINAALKGSKKDLRKFLISQICTNSWKRNWAIAKANTFDVGGKSVTWKKVIESEFDKETADLLVACSMTLSLHCPCPLPALFLCASSF